MKAYELQNRILYEDNHIIVVNKPSGLLCQGDATGDVSLLDSVREFIKLRDKKPGNVFVGLPHRVDRPVSGAVILAKTGKALSRMSEMFREGRVDKCYCAITTRLPNDKESGTLVHYLKKDEKKNRSTAKKGSFQGGKRAELLYTVLAASDNYRLSLVKLVTGRHHQIRCQLAAAGAPIKGDLKYGAPRSNHDGNISLHAWFLHFIHPVKREAIAIKAPLPEDPLWNYFNPLLPHSPQSLFR